MDDLVLLTDLYFSILRRIFLLFSWSMVPLSFLVCVVVPVVFLSRCFYSVVIDRVQSFDYQC